MNASIDVFKDKKITSDILSIINSSKGHCFNTRSIRFEVYKRRGYILRGKHRYHDNVYNNQELKMFVTNKIGHVVRKLKTMNLIKKVSNTTWKLLDNFDEKMESLYPKNERSLI